MSPGETRWEYPGAFFAVSPNGAVNSVVLRFGSGGRGCVFDAISIDGEKVEFGDLTPETFHKLLVSSGRRVEEYSAENVLGIRDTAVEFDCKFGESNVDLGFSGKCMLSVRESEKVLVFPCNSKDLEKFLGKPLRTEKFVPRHP